ncbi:MAG: GxxExxY protein [Ignavibacteria bacterium CG2_30_36_16]|nr:GxxExxY protein [Ignavibacteria bacterium]OIP58390.1 MAG: GxxExxY protein [Ignavibacteria bacterium CG2_30_36_16]PJB02369.1 MAG: GxxExxY protein [Ignavibacteria bacterium CG_4_9_14_3_um_filter_36_18]
MNTNFLYSEITDLILKAFFKVYNKLGHGFLEKVYENAMIIELNRLGLRCEKQKKIDVYYDEFLIGEYYADILVNEVVVVELKAAETLVPEHEAQLVNYLRGTDLEVGLLLNFGKGPQFKRKVLTKEFKKK